MAGEATDRTALRRRFEAAVLAELEAKGPNGLRIADLVRRFAGRGASRSTLFRWGQALLASGRAGAHLRRQAKAAATARARRAPDPAKNLAHEAAAALPKPIRLEDIAGSGGVIPVIERLKQCVEIADQIIAYARAPDGRPRMAKTMLAASEHLRRTLETAVKLQEALLQLERVDRFHAQVLAAIEEVAREFPEASELIARRLSALSAQWSTIA